MYVVFADLGKARDYAAQGIIQHVVEGDSPSRAVDLFVVTYLKRFPLTTSYHDQVEHFAKLMSHPALRGQADGVYDATGVGKAVSEIFQRQNVHARGITITSGQTVGHNAEGYTVPKTDIVDDLLVSMETGRLLFADNLDEEHVSQMKKEMKGLRQKVNPRTKHVGIEAGTEDIHDDMVMALCLGLWWLKKRAALVENSRLQDDYQRKPYNEYDFMEK